MKFTFIIPLLIITNFSFAITYTTTGVNTWDANGAPPAGWLTADIIINHSILFLRFKYSLLTIAI